MKQSYLQLLFLLLSVILFSCTKVASGENEENNTWIPESSSSSDVYVGNTDGYRTFRIPAAVRTEAGTVLAFAEGRKYSGSDTGNIDLVLKRSEDGGRTWEKIRVIWDDGDNTCGNPVPVVDPETGRIHLLMTWNCGEDTIGEINSGVSKDTRRVYYTYSDNDGIDWVQPKEITSSVKEKNWGWYATGPCHGIVVSKGKFKGRIVVPCDCMEVGEGRRQFSHVIYSDDKGESWHIGGVSLGGNESTVAETSDGRLLLNMRYSGMFRRQAYSSDGGMTWTESVENRDLVDPVCQGSILDSDIDGEHCMFFSNAASTTRDHLTIKKSTDNGMTWKSRCLINEGHSAYSDLVRLGDRELGVLYENGQSNPYQKISFEIVKI